MSYQALGGKTFRRGAYELVSLREQDILEIMRWRNSQMDILRQERALTEADQRAYFAHHVKPGFAQAEPSNILLSFLKDGECIGYGGLVHIQWASKRAEVSFLLETARTKDEASYETEFTAFLGLLKQVAFEALGLNRLWTETYDVRPTHVRTLEKNGLKPEGRMREHVIIDGKSVDSLLHGLLAREYGKSQG